MPLRTSLPTRNLPVFRSRDFRAVEGVNEGDPLSDATDLLHEDVYALAEEASPVRLDVITGPGARIGPRGGPRVGTGPMRLGPDSAAGTPGATLYLDCLLTFMGAAGGRHDALVFVEVDADGLIAETYLYPLAPFERKQGYVLVTIDRDGAAARLADAAQPACTHGPRIAPADGAQRRVGAGRGAVPWGAGSPL